MNPSHHQHESIDAATRDRTSPVWDMSQERVFIENLVNQRFNFLVVVFGFSIAGGINAKTQTMLIAVLSLGTLLCLALSSVLRRAQDKLDVILDYIYQDKSHPATIVNDLVGPSGSRRKLIGTLIPAMLVSVLFLASVLAIGGKLSPESLQQLEGRGSIAATPPLSAPFK